MSTTYEKTTFVLIQISLTAIMAALVAAVTLIVRIPNALGGYFNLGDVAIFAVAFTFNPVVGGLASGIGSSIADLTGICHTDARYKGSRRITCQCD